MKNPNDYDNTHSTYTNNLNLSEVRIVFGRRSCDLNQDTIAKLYIKRDLMNVQSELGYNLFFEFLYMCGNIDDENYYKTKINAKGSALFLNSTCMGDVHCITG